MLDLRTLSPLDRPAVLAVARHCSRVLIVHEDTRTGGIGESLAAIIQEEAFESLDAPVRIVGALDTPVALDSPPLEDVTSRWPRYARARDRIEDAAAADLHLSPSTLPALCVSVAAVRFARVIVAVRCSRTHVDPKDDHRRHS